MAGTQREIADFIPCTLCWYQRIAMYPLAVILTIAAFRGDGGIRVYAATLAVIRRETNTWRWPVFAWVYMTAIGYVGALLVYQLGS